MSMADPKVSTEFKKASLPSPTDEIYETMLDSLPSLAGKCYVVTGCTSGIGFWTAVAACRKGASCVIMANRASDRAVLAAEKVMAASAAAAEGDGQTTGATRVVTVECDLQSFASVRAAAAAIATIAEDFGGLDALVCNAGVDACTADIRTVDGYDVIMQTNHLSHFLLTSLLMPCLEASASARGNARVVQHSSVTRAAGLPLEGRFFEKSEPGTLGGEDGKFERYHQSKLANSVFGMTLHEKLKTNNSKVKSLVAEPGISMTDFWIRPDYEEEVLQFLQGTLVCPQSAADGACPLIKASFAEDANSGDFYMPEENLDKDRQPVSGVWPMGDCGSVRGLPVKTLASGQPNQAAPEWIRNYFQMEALTMDEANRSLLWTVSEKAVGGFAF